MGEILWDLRACHIGAERQGEKGLSKFSLATSVVHAPPPLSPKRLARVLHNLQAGDRAPNFFLQRQACWPVLPGARSFGWR